MSLTALGLPAILNQQGAAAGAFDPTTIAGLQLWLDADAISGLSDGDPIATWADDSGNARDATQATSSKRPIYKASIVNGKPVARFDGTDDGLATASFQAVGADGSWTTFAVAKRTAGTAVAHIVNQDDDPGAGTTNRVAQMLRLSSGALQSIAFSVSPVSAQTDTGPTHGSGFFLARGVATATTVEAFINGAGNGSTARSGTKAVLSQIVSIGIWGDLTSERLNGDIAEVLIYNSALSSTDIANVESYLADKYGITI